MKFRVVVIALVVAVVALVAFGLYQVRRHNVRPHVELSHIQYPVCGIDLSSHNGPVDFEELVKDSIDFVVMKATEGESFKDSRFTEFYYDAFHAGMILGAYHFFRFDADGEAQARNFIGSVAGKHFDFPLVIDVEEWGNPRFMSTETVYGRLKAMIDCLEINGYSVMIYTNKDGYNRFVKGRLEDYPLWICSFTTPPIDDDVQWLLWQYSHWGVVDACQSEVDLNTFNGSREQWYQWVKLQQSVD